MSERDMTEEQRDELRLELAIEAMKAIIPTFGEKVEPCRRVIAHKSFLIAEARLRAYEDRSWELPE